MKSFDALCLTPRIQDQTTTWSVNYNRFHRSLRNVNSIFKVINKDLHRNKRSRKFVY